MNRDTITLPRSVVEQALAALKIGHESAHDCAETFHIEMAGYKQQRHEALDAEVKQISDAIGVLRAAVEQPQVNSPEIPEGWKLVPVEPTDEMREAGKDAHYEAETRTSDADAWSLTGFAHRVVRASYIYRAMLAAAPQPPVVEQSQVEQDPVAHSIVAGALFDFMGWLTSRRERLVLSSTDDAAPAADAIKDFAKMRSLSISDAQVQKWQEHLSAPQPPRQPLTDEEILRVKGQFNGTLDVQFDRFARAIERAHGIGGEA